MATAGRRHHWITLMILIAYNVRTEMSVCKPPKRKVVPPSRMLLVLGFSNLHIIRLVIYLQYSSSRFPDSVWGSAIAFSMKTKTSSGMGGCTWEKNVQPKADSGEVEGEKFNE